MEKQILRINGNSIGLTANEIALLNVFSKYRNIVLSRDEIINELNRADYFQASGKKIINDRLIDLQITRLRKKIEREEKLSLSPPCCSQPCFRA